MSQCSELSQPHSDDSPRYAEHKAQQWTQRWAQAEGYKVNQPPGSWSCVKFPHLIVPEAFDGQPDRVPRQIAAATGVKLELVLKTFDEILQDTRWRGT